MSLPFCFACSQEDNNTSVTDNTTADQLSQSFASRDIISLQSIALELKREYLSQSIKPNTLEGKLELLSTIAERNENFKALIDNNYSTIKSSEVEDILVNTESYYDNLNCSIDFKKLLDEIVYESKDKKSIKDLIINSSDITQEEREILIIIMDHTDDPVDTTWRKRRGMIIMQGSNNGDAQVVYNSVIMSII